MTSTSTARAGGRLAAPTSAPRAAAPTYKTERSEFTLPLPPVCHTALQHHKTQQDRARDSAGVRRITVHDARRTCGTLLADLDVHPRVAMAILRHAQFSITTEIYTQVSEEQTGPRCASWDTASMADRRCCTPLLYSAAVLRCCTGSKEAMSVDGTWPATSWAILGSNQ